MTMHKTLHPRDDVDGLYVLRKTWTERERERGLRSIEDNVDASIQRLEDYIEKRRGRLITVTRNNTDTTRTNRTEIIWKKNKKKNKKKEEKQLYRRFKRLTNDISREKTWT